MSVLKAFAENDVDVFAIATPEAGIDSHHDAVVRVETKAESVIMFEVLQVEIGAALCDLAGVVEQRAIEPRPDLVSVFALQQQRVRPAKAVLAEAAQGVVAAE